MFDNTVQRNHRYKRFLRVECRTLEIGDFGDCRAEQVQIEEVWASFVCAVAVMMCKALDSKCTDLH